MALKGKTFSLDTSVVDQIISKWSKERDKIDKSLMMNVQALTNLIYNTARTRRPKVPVTKFNRGQYRVSDPDAALGVPVRTGALQASIKKEDPDLSGEKITARVYTEGIDYALHVEFGTSRMRARPFMQPAVDLNKAAARKIFGAAIK